MWFWHVYFAIASMPHIHCILHNMGFFWEFRCQSRKGPATAFDAVRFRLRLSATDSVTAHSIIQFLVAVLPRPEPPFPPQTSKFMLNRSPYLPQIINLFSQLIIFFDIVTRFLSPRISRFVEFSTVLKKNGRPGHPRCKKKLLKTTPLNDTRKLILKSNESWLRNRHLYSLIMYISIACVWFWCMRLVKRKLIFWRCTPPWWHWMGDWSCWPSYCDVRL